MLIGLYLFTPVLKKIADDKKIVEYWMVLCLLFCFIPKLFQLAPSLYGRYERLRQLVMITDYTSGYLAYYLMGHYIYYFGLKSKTKGVLYVLGSFSAIYGIIFSYLYSQKNHAFSKFPTQMQSLNTLLFVTAVFLFFSNVLSKISFVERSRKWIRLGGECTLGIYVLHPIFITLLKKLGILQSLSGQAQFVIPIASLLIFFCFIWNHCHNKTNPHSKKLACLTL